jgi:hypothetical protein
MKYAGMLAVIGATASSVGCTGADNVIGRVGRGRAGSSGAGAQGGVGNAIGGPATGGGTRNGAVGGGPASMIGGAPVGGATNRGGAPPNGAGGAGRSSAATGGDHGGSMSGASGNAGAKSANSGGAGGGSGMRSNAGGIGGSAGNLSGSGGSAVGSGGSPSGSGGSPSGSGGSPSGGTGGSIAAGFACPLFPATCNLIHTWTFSTTSQWQGTYTYSQPSIRSDYTTEPTVFRVTGMVGDYAGFGVYTAKCTSLAGFTGVTFTLKGTLASVDKPNTLTFFVLTNTDEPIDMTGMTGECPGLAGVDCASPHRVITTSDRPQTVMFSDLTGGKPVALLDVNEVLGLRWQIEPDASQTPFAIDLSLSDVTLIGPGPKGDCSTTSATPPGSGGTATGG